MANEMKIHPRFRISRDPNNFVVIELLTRTRTKDDPKGAWRAGDTYEEWSAPCYPADPAQLLNVLLRRKALSSHAETLEQMMDELRCFKDEVLATLREAIALYEAALQKEADSHAGDGNHIHRRGRKAAGGR